MNSDDQVERALYQIFFRKWAAIVLIAINWDIKYIYPEIKD